MNLVNRYHPEENDDVYCVYEFIQYLHFLKTWTTSA